MGKIFLSHSSQDNYSAVAMRDWLYDQGWDDVFLDLDPDRGIAAGERWERRLYEAANRCEAVIFLISQSWLSSEWCLREFDLAVKLNKRIFGVIIDNSGLDMLPKRVSGVWQIVNLAQGEDHRTFRAVLPSGTEGHVTFSTAGLRRLKSGLERAGLDPRFFAWPPGDDPDRPPYRGLLPLEAEDAGIFFGRDASIISAVDQLRGLAEGAPPRFMVMLGASGAGKSSFLRAGLLPRLSRDERRYLTLAPIRPERRIINGDTGLLQSLVSAAKQHGLRRSRSDIRRAIDRGAPSLLGLLGDLLESAGGSLETDQDIAPITRSIVLSIDQGEELFGSDGREEADRFLPLLRELLVTQELPLIVLMTIRSDAYEQLQSNPVLSEIACTPFNLPPLPRGAYQTVIEGPAARLKDSSRPLKIEPALTSALLADIEVGGAKDALPLLAFTLERLYLEHGGDADLRLSEYRHLGGIRGSIEAAVQKVLTAADRYPELPRDHVARLALLRRTFIPWLAGIDPETRSPRRLVARRAELADAGVLVDLLVEARLLSTDVSSETGEITVEPAHEALLRQWGLLQGWLEEDIAILSTLEALQRAVRDWSANAEDAAWLTHQGGRLDDAEALLDRADIAAKLTPTDHKYLRAAREAETRLRDRELEEARRFAEAQRQIAEEQEKKAEAERRTVKRTRVGAAIAAALAIVAVGVGIFGWQQMNVARQQTEVARQQTDVAEERRVEALERLQRAQMAESRFLATTAEEVLKGGDDYLALGLALAALPEDYRPGKPVDRPLLAPAVEALSHVVGTSNWVQQFAEFSHINDVAFSPDGTRIVTALSNGNAQMWDVRTGAALTRLTGHEASIRSVQFSRDGKFIVTGSEDGTARVWDGVTGAPVGKPMVRDAGLGRASISPDGKRVATASRNTIRIWDAETDAMVCEPMLHDSDVFFVDFAPDGKRVASASVDKTVRIWDVATCKQVGQPIWHSDWVAYVVFSPGGDKILTASHTLARLWDLGTGLQIGEPMDHPAIMAGVDFSPRGDVVLTTTRGNVYLWDARTAEAIGTPIVQSAGITAAKFSPDGSQVLTASPDGAARIFPLPKPRQGWSIGPAGLTDVFVGDEMRVAFERNGTLLNVRTMSTGATVGKPILLDEPLDSYVHEVSPDGGTVITIPQNGAGQIWDVATGARIGQAIPFDERIKSTTFSNDGQLILTFSESDTVRVWDALTGQSVGVPIRHPDSGAESEPARTVFLDSGKKILTWNSNSFRLWNARTGSPIGDIVKLDDGSSIKGFSRDDLKFATVLGGTVSIWDATTGSRLAQSIRQEEAVDGVTFSPDGRQILTTSRTQSLARLWDIESGSQIGETIRHGEIATGSLGISALNALFSPDGRRIVTGSVDGRARLWDTRTGLPIGAPLLHEGIMVVASFSPDSKLVLTTSVGTARTWDAETGAPKSEMISYKDLGVFASFSEDGRYVQADTDGVVYRWNIETGKPETFDYRADDKFKVLSSLVGPGDLALTATPTSEISFVDPVGQAWTAPTIKLAKRPRLVLFSPDGSRLLTVLSDNTARVWDVRTGNAIGVPVRLDDEIQSAALSPDGSHMVTASADTAARIWDVSSGKAVGAPIRHDGKIVSAVFSPDGRSVLTASADKTARVSDAQSGARTVELRIPDAEVVSTAYSPDGLRIVTGSANGVIQIWNARTGTADGAAMTQVDPVSRLRFSRDGTLLITTAGETGIRIWEARTGARYHDISTDGNVRDFSLSRDGKQIWLVEASGSEQWAGSVPTTLFKAPMPPALDVFLSKARASQTWPLSEHHRREYYLEEPEHDLLVSNPGQVTECDRLATQPNDPQGLAPAVYFASISPTAVDACQEALKEDPENPRLRFLLGRSLSSAKKVVEAYAAFSTAAEKGYPMAFYQLGLAYRSGTGTEADAAKARDHLLRALSEGAYAAGSVYGDMLWDGEGVAVDMKMAVEIWTKAALIGDARSHEKLAWVAEFGRDGSPIDLATAFYHYAAAVKIMEESNDDSNAYAARYRRASLARTLDANVVDDEWKRAMDFVDNLAAARSAR